MKNIQLGSILNQIEIETIGMMRCFSFNDKRLAYCDNFTRNGKDKRNRLNIQLLQIQWCNKFVKYFFFSNCNKKTVLKVKIITGFLIETAMLKIDQISVVVSGEVQFKHCRFCNNRHWDLVNKSSDSLLDGLSNDLSTRNLIFQYILMLSISYLARVISLLPVLRWRGIWKTY